MLLNRLEVTWALFDLRFDVLFVSLFVCLVGWWVDWLIGWLVDWLIGWLVDWLIDWLIDCGSRIVHMLHTTCIIPIIIIHQSHPCLRSWIALHVSSRSQLRDCCCTQFCLVVPAGLYDMNWHKVLSRLSAENSGHRSFHNLDEIFEDQGLAEFANEWISSDQDPRGWRGWNGLGEIVGFVLLVLWRTAANLFDMDWYGRKVFIRTLSRPEIRFRNSVQFGVTYSDCQFAIDPNDPERFLDLPCPAGFSFLEACHFYFISRFPTCVTCFWIIEAHWFLHVHLWRFISGYHTYI